MSERIRFCHFFFFWGFVLFSKLANKAVFGSCKIFIEK